MKLTLTRADEDELILRCRDPDAPHIRALLALLGALMFAGLIAMLIGEQFKQEIETDQLNEALRSRRPTE